MSTSVCVRIAHISDPHFGTVVPAVREALLHDLHESPPELILLTGDITQRARRGQFREAAAFLEALPAVPRLCLPGNHDIPLFDVFTRALNPYRNYRRYIAADLAPSFVDERVAVLCVDATRRTRHTDGVLDEAQIEAVAQRLARVKAPFRLVATHQPLAAKVESDDHNVIHGARAALDRWIAAGADLFLGGHIHLPYCVEVRTGDRRDASVLLQAGTSLSHRIRDGIPNSYNRVTLRRESGERSLHIERRDFDAATRRFGPVATHQARSFMDRGRTGLNGWRLSAP